MTASALNVILKQLPERKMGDVYQVQQMCTIDLNSRSGSLMMPGM